MVVVVVASGGKGKQRPEGALVRCFLNAFMNKGSYQGHDSLPTPNSVGARRG